jgi:serine/threonine protein phosphatase 1
MAKSPPTDLKRVIAIGDIHGCSKALAALLADIQPRPEDTVISLGDVIDYGPDTRGVLRQLRELSKKTNFILLTGNHEEMLLNSLDRGWDPDGWIRTGGEATLESYGVEHPKDIPAEDIAFLRTAKPYFETPTHAFVHAGYYPNLPLSETPGTTMFWEPLDPDKTSRHYTKKTFVVGHTPQTSGEVLDLGYLLCIDTDCSRGNWLTGLDTTTGRIHQANQNGELAE